ncbi:Fe-S cluster assembly protein SufD [Brevundimonas sp. Root1279]|uniref:Fe-S cluster assembly protein SufD n=1 Tax=Brevundimonas sp. Root1279 TaxID=1736443 RepID=UPI0006FAD5A2|nr:Fe-S cluster assembly protein SufD [Brevundimonas sp. Root1279]KQW83628.1 ABC transporter permease [Brevundimonas sp. Root1279]
MNTPVRIDLKDPSSFPSRRVEAWKYTDLRKFLRESPAPSPEGVVAPGGPFAALGGAELAFVNGRCEGFPGIVAEGENVVRLRFVSTGEGTGHEARVTIDVKAGASLVLLESYEGLAPAYVSNVELEITVGEGASLTRVILAEDSEDAIGLSQAHIALAHGATLHQAAFSAGGKLQRTETRVEHPGHGAFVRLDGAYILSGARHADFTSIVDHGGPDGRTSQLTKGVVRDAARGVFQGKIIVERGADGTDARMGHHALILGERAEIDAKPELIIYADDVQCAHGNTVGNLDQNALFYMQQRGIPLEEARALLTEAFLMEVVDRIEHDGAKEVVRAWLTDRL